MVISTATLAFLIVLNEPHQFSMLDLWERKCKEGNADACKRLAHAQAGAEKLARLDSLAQRYGNNSNRDELEQDGRPLLNKAYKQVMENFINAEHKTGNEELNYDEDAVSYCADHFHNYWVNRKLWWPTDENGDPSWVDIYYYIIDHYYGICLRRSFNQL